MDQRQLGRKWSGWDVERKGMVEVWVGHGTTRRKSSILWEPGPHKVTTRNHVEGSGRTTQGAPFRDLGTNILSVKGEDLTPQQPPQESI